MNEFINRFAAQFDDTERSVFNENTRFHDLEEWSSLIALAECNMIKRHYGVIVSIIKMSEFDTIADLFSYLQNK